MSNPLTSRGAMAYVGAVLAGGISATCLAYALGQAGNVLVLVAYLTAIPLFLAGLGGGKMPGLLAALVGCFGLLAIMPSNYAVIYAFLFAVPAAGLCFLALRNRKDMDGETVWFPEGSLLTAITLYPSAIFIAIGFSTMSINGGFQGLTSRMLHEVFAPALAQIPAENAEQASAIFDSFIKILPAIVGCAFILSTIISMYVGQMLAQQQKWNLRPPFKLERVRMPNWLIALLAVSIIGTFAAVPYDYIGLNLAIIFSIPFFFAGISVVHALAPLTGWPTTVLIIFYLLISVVVWLSLLVVMLGITDQWINFRQRFSARINTATI